MVSLAFYTLISIPRSNSEAQLISKESVKHTNMDNWESMTLKISALIYRVSVFKKEKIITKFDHTSKQRGEGEEDSKKQQMFATALKISCLNKN